MKAHFWGILTGVALCLAGGPRVYGEPNAVPGACSPDGSLSVDVMVARAIRMSPTLTELEGRLETARAQLTQSQLLLDNPSVDADWDVADDYSALRITQPFGPPGYRRALRKAARHQIAAEEARLKRARLEVAQQTRLLLIEASIAHQNARLAEENDTLSARLSTIVQAKVTVGEAAVLDLRLARLEEAQALAELLETSQAENDAILLLAQQIQCQVSREQLPNNPAASVLASSDGTDPGPSILVEAAQSSLAEKESAITQARAQRLPSGGIGAFMESERGARLAGPSLSFVLPVFNRNQVRMAEARAGRDVARAELIQTEVEVASQRQLARRQVALAERARARISGDSMEDAYSALESIEEGYRVGELDLPQTLLLRSQVLKGQQAVLSLQREQLRAHLNLLLAMDSPALLGGE